MNGQFLQEMKTSLLSKPWNANTSIHWQH